MSRTRPDWQFEPATDTPTPDIRLPVRIGIGLAVINLLVIITVPLARLYLQAPSLPAFRIFFNALQAGVVLGLLGLLLILITAISRNRFATRGGLWMLVPGIVPAALVIAIVGPANLSRPMIHDITTDTENPPQFVEVRKLRSATQNSVEYDGAQLAAQQLTAYPDLAPIHTAMTPDDALTEAIQVAKDLGWEFINIDYTRGLLEAYDTTRLFGFVDDVIIRVRGEGTGSRIDIRSVSRVGKGDLGQNADRIRRFIRAYRT